MTPNDNPALYRYQIERLAGLLDRRSNISSLVRASGYIINTMGWIDGLGYELLLHSIEALRADVVIVIGQDKLHSDLMGVYRNSKTVVVKLQRSGGVVTRPREYRRISRDNRIKEYFYGPAYDLSPSSSSVPLSEWKIYRVGGGPRAPDSALPIGAKPIADPVRVTPVEITKELTHSILAVIHATDADVSKIII